MVPGPSLIPVEINMILANNPSRSLVDGPKTVYKKNFVRRILGAFYARQGEVDLRYQQSCRFRKEELQGQDTSP